MNKKLILPIIIVVLIIIFLATNPTFMSLGKETNSNSQMPNPASVSCENQGYQIEIRTASDGSQYGVCIFDDGSECEEWKYYRSECFKGEYAKWVSQ